MKRRNFFAAVAAFVAAPSLPLPAAKPKLLLIADEYNELPGWDPKDYVGEYKWQNFAEQPGDIGSFRGFLNQEAKRISTEIHNKLKP